METAEAERVERALAIARAILAVASLAAISLTRVQTAHYVFTYSVLIDYAVYSILLLLVPTRGGSRPAALALAQAIDMAWASVLIAGTGGGTSSFFVFYTFTVVSAAYRWGFWGSIGNGILAASIYFALSAPALDIIWNGLSADLDGLFIPTVYLLLTSVVLGYLAENERRLRRENGLIARAMGHANAESGLTRSMHGALGEIRAFYAAEAALFVTEEAATGNIYLLSRTAGEMDGEFGHFAELDPTRRFLYFFSVPGRSWYSTRYHDAVHHARFLDAGKRRLENQMMYPREFVDLHRFESLLGGHIEFGQELSGRLFVLNPKLKVGVWQELAFVQRIIGSVTPSLYNVYLWRRLRARAGAMERARVARDLHDGVIQSLIGIEMQLDVMKHQSKSGKLPGTADLEGVQGLLRSEIIKVRELMNELRQPRLEPSELVKFMSEQVDKFARETGIAARFVSETDQMSLPPDVCREVVQILQEALANVRKHSKAAHLLVRLSAPEDDWNLAIIDDGRGFDFEGRLSHSQLDEKNLGPLVIKERVRLIHGELEIESVPGHGARLDVRLPKRIYA